MEITEVKVFPIQEEKLRAFVSIVIDRCFMVNYIKVISGRDGLFISIPSRRKKNADFTEPESFLNHLLDLVMRLWAIKHRLNLLWRQF